MKESVLQLFTEYQGYAIIISLALSIAVAVAGLLPSVFITAANIIFFGFWNGILISFAGEALGAAIAFLLYRKGFQKPASNKLQRFPKLVQLLHAPDRKAFQLIILLRLIPFVPSGLVTFAAAVGRTSFTTFLVASSLGKIPALLLEGYSVYEVGRFQWQGKLILGVAAIALFYFVVKGIFSRQGD